MKFQQGDKVRLIRPLDRFPHFLAQVGLTGTVSNVEPHIVAVKLDQYLDGAEMWENEIHWSVDAGLEEIEKDLEICESGLKTAREVQ